MKNERPVGIIAAMPREAEGILAAMENVTEETVSGVRFAAGTLCGHPAVTAVCGIGKVFAALCAEAMILRYEPRLILNTGVAGSLSPALSIGDVAVADSLVQHDMDTTSTGDPPGMLPGLNRIFLPCDPDASARLADCVRETGAACQTGVIASGDVFVSDSERKRLIASRFGAIACEMEGAAIGHVCFVNRVPCAVIRAVSDGGDENASFDFPTFAGQAADRAVRVIRLFFERL